MTGTILNIITVLIGGGLGTLFGSRLPERVRETVLWGLGLFVTALGVKMTFDSHNVLISLGSVLVGGLLGEWWQIDEALKRSGTWLEARFNRGSTAESTARFIRGYVTASLIFCTGPMAILGSIQDGLKGDFQLLAIKSVLDGFAALAFSASLGVGVLFSTISILLYQGGISLLATFADKFLTTPMIDEMTAVGGLLVMGIGLGALLELRPIRVSNYLPALVVAPLIVAVLHVLGVAGF